MLSYFAIPLLFTASTTTATPKPAIRPVVTACAAVTRSDIAQALGVTIEKREEQKEEASSTCDYSRGEGMVSVTVQRGQRKLDLETEIASLKASIPDSAVRETSGLGKRAFFLDIPGAGTQLYVINGESDFLMVSVLGFGEASRVSPAAAALARKALGRL